MAQTTTAVNACDVVVSLDDDAGTLDDISGSSNQVSMSMSRQVAETFTFDGDWAIKKGCKKAVTISLQAVYSVTDSEATNVLVDWYFNSAGTSRTIQIDVPDSTVGSDRYSGEMTIESLDIPLDASDAGVILVSASLSNDGAFTRTAISS
jgi:hypothetical protein